MKNEIIKNGFKYKSFFTAFLLLFLIVGERQLFAGSELEVTGNITELGSDYLVVQGYKFYVDANTVFRGPGNSIVSFSYFHLNSLVEVKGNSTGNGNYLAERVKSEDTPGSTGEFEVTGYVTEKGAVSFVINNKTFYVDANTIYMGHNAAPYSFEQISVGSLLEVKAVLQLNGDLLAKIVKEEDDHQNGGELEITGHIDNITLESITIGQHLFHINSETLVNDHNNQPVTFNTLKIGDLVEVKAYRQVDNSYLAVLIHLENENENEIEITAQIENISGTDILVGGMLFTTSPNTIYLDHNRVPITFADLTTGMFVEVEGFKDNNNINHAVKIHIEDFVQSEIEFKGSIQSLTNNSLLVNGIEFLVSEATVVLDHLNNPIAYSSLTTGEIVEIKGNRTGAATVNALLIKRESNEDIEVFGRLTAKTTGSIELNGLIITVNEKTLYFNHSNQQITFAEITAGQMVEVKMVKNTPSSLLAIRIKIEDGINFSKVTGTAGIITGSSIQLPTGSYAISSSTIIVDKNYKRINISLLESGLPVTVWGVMESGANLNALQIQSKVALASGINEEALVLSGFDLGQNYPNPFNPATRIRFTLNNDQNIILKVFNATGEEVIKIADGNYSKGTHEVTFNAQGLSSGIYFYRLESGSDAQVKKMMVIK